MLVPIAILCLACAGFSAADRVNSVQCNNTEVASSDVIMEVSGCSMEDEECRLHKGENYTVTFRFTTNSEFKNDAKYRVYGLFKNIPVRHGRALPACPDAVVDNSTDTCESLGGFLEGRRFIHTSVFRVSPNYPSIRLGVRFLVNDRHKNQLFCEEVKVAIVDEDGNVGTTEEPTE